MVKLKNLVYLLFVLSLIFLSSCKENSVSPTLFGSISGTVVDAEDQSIMIDGASITTSPPTSSISTDSNGEFLIEDIATGNYTLTVSKVGYRNKTVTISVKEDQVTEATIFLEKEETTDPPGQATDPDPEDEAVDQPRDITLLWNAPASTSGETVKYDVYLYDANLAGAELIASGIEDTTITVEDLGYEQTYFWQVNTTINDTLETEGDVWSFSTRAFPDYRLHFASRRDGNFEIYTADTSETNQDVIRLTDQPFRDWWPRLSPNRSEIAFSSDSDIDAHIYVMDRKGNNKRKVTTLPIAGYHNNGIGFSWAPDGGHFIYSHYDRLYRIDENGANLTLIATAPAGRHFRECSYSPSGDRIVALTIGENIYDTEIYIMNADGSNLSVFLGNLPGMIASPSFSIDGNSIVYTHDVSGYESGNGRQLDARIFIKKLSDGTVTEVSTNKPAGTNDTQPRFIADGSKIIFSNAVNDGVTPKDIYMVELDGDNRELIITNGEMPSWE